MIKIDIAEIEKRIAAGLIRMEKHPFLDLYLYNYTTKTQFDWLWDDYTKMCRGLILDSEHNIVAKPFSKFFNLNEMPETMIQNLPAELPSIAEKLDGSLGVIYPENDLPAVSTRGGFYYDQARWATEWLRQKGFTMDDFHHGYTYCVEIVYPGSKNVVNYGNRAELVLLAVLSNSNNHELDYVKEAEELGIPFAKQYDFSEVSQALEYLKTVRGNVQEGFVCRYSNGFRVKIKSDEYKRLHKILSGVSARDIWTALKNGESLEPLLELVPDEFYRWVKLKEAELNASKNDIMNRAKVVVGDAGKLHSRKEQANYILSHASSISGVVFPLLDGHADDAECAAWKMIKPSGEVFKRDESGDLS